MSRIFFIFLASSIFLPASASAAGAHASFIAARSLLAASSSPGNAYAAGASVVLTAPVAGDFSAFGGSIVTAAPVSGDGLLVAGSVSSRAKVAGDLRVLGGSISVEETVLGDLIALGLSVNNSGRVSGNSFIIAANAVFDNGASGPVTIYGNNIALSGDFRGDVDIVASGRVTLAPDTVIRGKLIYEAPDTATIPESATVIGGIKYTSASYLPDVGTSRILALVSLGFFLFARILGALILAGLLAGLFPKLAEAVSERAHTDHLRSLLLTMLLGFAILVAAPVLIILLALTFVGIGLSILLVLLYALLALFSFLYAGILLGNMFARRFLKREAVLWRDGVLGMLALSLITLVPGAGPLLLFFLTIFSAGALLTIFFNFAFPHEERTSEML
ncbi:MAG: polymer-forming cytoskeletal protein [bacterium]|nr:polymer-forming cytoskeletal protein [bacterium]